MTLPPKAAPRHFIDLDSFSRDGLTAIIRHGHLLKKQNRTPREDLKGKTLALLFEKPSTRTRVSFELAMVELGGHTIPLTGSETQFGHGESVADTARVLSRFAHVLAIRTYDHVTLQELAKHATIPVINALTDYSHPCQVMADLMTIEERFHRLNNLVVAWLGDGDNNVLTSWMHAASLFGFELRIACPDAYKPQADVLAANQAKAKITLIEDPDAAVDGTHVVVTDSWISMHNTDADARRQAFRPYQVTAARMARARKEAIFMHCLPAHRGEEVTDEVIDGPQSAVWDEAENRLHVQKGILSWCLGRI